MKVAYLGPPGTFSEEAALKWVAGEAEQAGLYPQSHIPEILSCVASGEAQLGVIPVENSIEGTVNAALDSITENQELFVVGEIILPVEQHLVMDKKYPLETLNSLCFVYSHPQALAQCGKYLRERLPKCKLRQTASTAEAAQFVASRKNKHVAGICSSFAARRYGLEIIEADIHQFTNNKTRFLVIAKKPFENTQYQGEGKTSLVFSLAEDRPGGLYLVLKDFAEANINLTKIESRPSKQELGRYLFFLDCQGWAWEQELGRVIAELKLKTSFSRVLGTYPMASGD